MQAEWNGNAIAELSREDNLLNLCRQFEQAHVDWRRLGTYGADAFCTEWPAIGEMDRYRVDGVEVRFVTTQHRKIKILDAARKEYARISIQPGMADRMYLVARNILLAQSATAA
jgi:hypothetical protein